MTILKKGLMRNVFILIMGPLAMTTVMAQSGPDDGDVNRDGRTTPADALCVFRRFLGLESCLDSLGMRTILVNCTAGETIAQALQMARSGDTIQVSGTCQETVTITIDRLTLDGQGSAIIDGGGQDVMTIDGARGVTLAGFTVRNGNDGLVARNGAAVILNSLTAQENTDDGFEIREGSTSQFTNCTAQSNGNDGFNVTMHSQGLFTGTILSTQNGDDGIAILLGSSGSGIEATIAVNQNARTSLAGDGLHVTNNSTFFLSTTTTLETIGNGEGIDVFRNASVNLSATAGINARGNMRDGLRAFQNSSITIGSTTPLRIEENGGNGVSVTINSSALLLSSVSGLRVIQNNTGGGLFIERNSDINMTNGLVQMNGGVGMNVVDSSVVITDATISGNGGADVALSFGARSTLNRTTIGSLPITCDGTVLSRGGTVCP